MAEAPREGEADLVSSRSPLDRRPWLTPDLGRRGTKGKPPSQTWRWRHCGWRQAAAGLCASICRPPSLARTLGRRAFREDQGLTSGDSFTTLLIADPQS
ncbi:hypothetical protein KM043_012756 [Ampulex compressa]|nr:hypothetical protein KM043_012756 [Ampulex compressa]